MIHQVNCVLSFKGLLSQFLLSPDINPNMEYLKILNIMKKIKEDKPKKSQNLLTAFNNSNNIKEFKVYFNLSSMPTVEVQPKREQPNFFISIARSSVLIPPAAFSLISGFVYCLINFRSLSVAPPVP